MDLAEQDRVERAKLLKPFADVRVQRLVQALLRGEKCTHELAEYTLIPQSTVSYQMKMLCESGFVKRRRDGKWTYYGLCPEGVTALKEELEHMVQVCDRCLNSMKR